MATIERRYLPPLNPRTTLTEADPTRAYDIIGKELADVVGRRSYYPDGMQKDAQTRVEDLDAFITSIEALQQQVDDPANILGGMVQGLQEYSKAVKKRVKKDTPVDNIELPPDLSPTTEDTNTIYVDPNPGPFSPPNPLSPQRRPKDRRASLPLPGSEVGPFSPNVDAQHNVAAQLSDTSNLRGLVSGEPMRRFAVHLPIFNTRLK